MKRSETAEIMASSVLDYCIARGIIEQTEDGTLDDADVALVRAQLDEMADADTAPQHEPEQS